MVFPPPERRTMPVPGNPWKRLMASPRIVLPPALMTRPAEFPAWVPSSSMRITASETDWTEAVFALLLGWV